MSNEKTGWSLQNDVRTEEERNVFKPTGKKPKKKHTLYLIAVIVAFLVVSFIMTYFSETTLEACITDTFCINSKDNLILYSFYVFITIVTVVLAITFAYLFGKRFADLIKPKK